MASEPASFQLVSLGSTDASIAAGMVAICGEHIHRTAGLDHWYPIRRLDTLVDRLAASDLWGVRDDELLVAVFALSEEPLPYYGDLSTFHIPADQPYYLSALAVLPSHQGSGVGRFAMAEADGLVAGRGGDAIRFDAVTTNTPAVAFYRRLGYSEAGVIPVGTLTVTCFERAFRAQDRDVDQADR